MNVFSCFLNSVQLTSLSGRLAGKLFQIRGPAAAKHLSPKRLRTRTRNVKQPSQGLNEPSQGLWFCREAAQCFVSLNVLLSHSRSLKVIRNDALEQGVCKSLLVFHCNCVSIVYHFLIYSTSNNGATLNSGLEVIQGH